MAVDRPIAPPTDLDGEGVNLVYETNETNNNLAAEQRHGCHRRLRRPTLNVSSVTAPASATAGQQLAVGWTVTNTGAAHRQRGRSPIPSTSPTTRSSIRPTATWAR